MTIKTDCQKDWYTYLKHMDTYINSSKDICSDRSESTVSYSEQFLCLTEGHAGSVGALY